jgi:hypothetical protein
VMMGWVARGLDGPMVVGALLLPIGCLFSLIDSPGMLMVILERGESRSDMALMRVCQQASGCDLPPAAGSGFLIGHVCVQNPRAWRHMTPHNSCRSTHRVTATQPKPQQGQPVRQSHVRCIRVTESGQPSYTCKPYTIHH